MNKAIKHELKIQKIGFFKAGVLCAVDSVSHFVKFWIRISEELQQPGHFKLLPPVQTYDCNMSNNDSNWLCWYILL